jgi:hypothetical protein
MAHPANRFPCCPIAKASLWCASVLGGLACLAAATGEQETPQYREIALFNNENLDGWKLKDDAEHPDRKSHWTVGISRMHPLNSFALYITPPRDDFAHLVNNGREGLDLYTVEKFSDCTLAFDAMLPQQSSAGVYLMGEYEISLRDSFGKTDLQADDMGGIAGTAAPRENAARPLGYWQRMIVEFEAPRFENGKKVRNARFVKVTLNGKVIHENVELAGVTPGGLTSEESPTGPLLLEGKEGPVAFRNLHIRTPAAK